MIVGIPSRIAEIKASGAAKAWNIGTESNLVTLEGSEHGSHAVSMHDFEGFTLYSLRVSRVMA